MGGRCHGTRQSHRAPESSAALTERSSLDKEAFFSPLPQPLLRPSPPCCAPPSPKPLSLIAVPGSRKNVTFVASVSLEDCEAALKCVLCGRLVGWGLSSSLIIGGKSQERKKWEGRTDRQGDTQREMERQNTESDRDSETLRKRDTEVEEEAAERGGGKGRETESAAIATFLRFPAFL